MTNIFEHRDIFSLICDLLEPQQVVQLSVLSQTHRNFVNSRNIVLDVIVNANSTHHPTIFTIPFECLGTMQRIIERCHVTDIVVRIHENISLELSKPSQMMAIAMNTTIATKIVPKPYIETEKVDETVTTRIVEDHESDSLYD